MKRTNYKKSRNTAKSKSSQFRARDTERETKKECANDPSWYTVSGQLTKDVASLSFNNPSGIQYSLNSTSQGAFVGPGIFNLYMAPTPGYSEGLSSPINIAAKNIYSFVRHANSGHANYDSPDLILMILGMANAFAYYGWMTRLYGMLRVYSQKNRYLGANMLKACGVDADNLLTNMANFRAYINQYALKLSALSVPATMSLFKRYMWMFSNVFSDENDEKAQFYMYQPAYFYMYDEYNGAGRLLPKPLCMDNLGTPFPVTGMTFGSLVIYGDALIGALIGSEDINIMSGDILKAYGSENIWKLQLIPEDYSIAPMFSEEVLSQIHNTVFVGSNPLNSTTLTDVGWGSYQVAQDTSIGNGCLVCKPLTSFGGNINSSHLMDFWKNEVTPDDVIVASRNIISGIRWAQGFTAVTGFGTEIPIMAAIANLNAAGQTVLSPMFDTDDKATFDAAITSASQALAVFSKLAYFNEHPLFYLVDYGLSSSPYAAIDASSSCGELSNFTVVNSDDIEKMHLSAVLSELAVPMLGNIVRG